MNRDVRFLQARGDRDLLPRERQHFVERDVERADAQVQTFSDLNQPL